MLIPFKDYYENIEILCTLLRVNAKRYILLICNYPNSLRAEHTRRVQALDLDIGRTYTFLLCARAYANANRFFFFRNTQREPYLFGDPICFLR